MKKINNKGITLIELIVSFAIVGVAIIYFFQTLYTVKKVYITAKNETNSFIDKSYTIRVISEYLDKQGAIPEDVCVTYGLSCTKASFDSYYFNGIKDASAAQDSDASYGKYYRIKVENETNSYYIYKHWISLDAHSTFRPYFPGFSYGNITESRNNVITASYGGTTAKYTFSQSLSGDIKINYSLAKDGCDITNTTTFRIDGQTQEVNYAGSDWSNGEVMFSSVSENSKLTVEVNHSGSSNTACTVYTAINSITTS